MHAITVSAILCVLVVAPTFAEESGAVLSDASGKIAGYQPGTNVDEHAKIDLDIKEIQDELGKKTAAGYTAAKNIYDNGKNSAKSSGKRAISSFALKTGEPFGALYDKYNADKTYLPHDLVTAALQGSDDAIYGQFATGSIANKDDFRSQVVKKVIKFQIVMLYALHEMEAALVKYQDASLKGTEALHALDEWWAFYAGSLEDGKASGYSTYILAEKRSKFFGKDKATVGNGGVSEVNKILLASTKEFHELLESKGNEAKLSNILKCVRAQLKVPLIQGCIQYAYKTDKNTAYPGDDTSAARKGELWAFCSGVLPFLHEVNPSAAEKLRAQADIMPLDNINPDFEAIKDVFSADNLNKMGVSCADVGGFVDKSEKKTSLTTKGIDFQQCTDTSAGPNNANADSDMCVAYASSSASRSGSGWLLVLSAVVAALGMTF